MEKYHDLPRQKVDIFRHPVKVGTASIGSCLPVLVSNGRPPPVCLSPKCIGLRLLSIEDRIAACFVVRVYRGKTVAY